jgi:hypothetical protein
MTFIFDTGSSVSYFNHIYINSYLSGFGFQQLPVPPHNVLSTDLQMQVARPTRTRPLNSQFNMVQVVFLETLVQTRYASKVPLPLAALQLISSLWQPPQLHN